MTGFTEPGEDRRVDGVVPAPPARGLQSDASSNDPPLPPHLRRPPPSHPLAPRRWPASSAVPSPPWRSPPPPRRGPGEEEHTPRRPPSWSIPDPAVRHPGRDADAWGRKVPGHQDHRGVPGQPPRGRGALPPRAAPYTAAEYTRAEGDEKRELRKRRNRWFKDQFAAFRESWVEGMVDGDDPLRDRMTPMWHGVHFFPRDQRPSLIIEQHQTIRSALGRYSELLHAMLETLRCWSISTTTTTGKGRPNENLAREVWSSSSARETTGRRTSARPRAA